MRNYAKPAFIEQRSFKLEFLGYDNSAADEIFHKDDDDLIHAHYVEKMGKHTGFDRRCEN